MSEAMTYSKYWSEVRSLAETIRAHCAETGDDEGDALHEHVDGHEFVIYTAKNFDVLRHCSNHDAYTDEFGEVPMEGGSINWAALAFAAFQQDVREELASLPEPEEEEEVAE